MYICLKNPKAIFMLPPAVARAVSTALWSTLENAFFTSTALNPGCPLVCFHCYPGSRTHRVCTVARVDRVLVRRHPLCGVRSNPSCHHTCHRSPEAGSDADGLYLVRSWLLKGKGCT
jgi:hypothetical protein